MRSPTKILTNIHIDTGQIIPSLLLKPPKPILNPPRFPGGFPPKDQSLQLLCLPIYPPNLASERTAKLPQTQLVQVAELRAPLSLMRGNISLEYGLLADEAVPVGLLDLLVGLLGELGDEFRGEFLGVPSC